MKEKINMIYPSYLKEFKCTGGSCEDNCCNGWEINIDKTTFDQYSNIKDKKMNNHIIKNIMIKDKCKDASIDYGQIKLKHNNMCPFLSRDKYCTIHSELGEEYLSDVCATYPRIINKVDNYYEISLDVSCIEAARIVFSKEEGIDFEECEGVFGKYALAMKIDTNDPVIKDNNIRYLKEIRNLSIKIIKNRKHSLSERLYMLGSFLEIARKELCYNYNNVNEFINRYDIESFGGEFRRDEINYLLQLSFFRDILEKLGVFNGCKSNYFISRIKEVISGFRFDEHKSLIENSELYLEAYKICEEKIFNKYSYVFENYLVNHMFKELFPFSESDVIINDYIMMLTRFAYIRFYIVGQYLYSGEISKEKVILSIQSLMKEIEHDKSYLKDIRRYIIENELDNRRFAKILL